MKTIRDLKAGANLQLSAEEVSALGWAVRNYKRCFPQENRNATKNGPFQVSFDKLRAARSGLEKLRAMLKLQKAGL